MGRDLEASAAVATPKPPSAARRREVGKLSILQWGGLTQSEKNASVYKGWSFLCASS